MINVNLSVNVKYITAQGAGGVINRDIDETYGLCGSTILTPIMFTLLMIIRKISS